MAKQKPAADKKAAAKIANDEAAKKEEAAKLEAAAKEEESAKKVEEDAKKAEETTNDNKDDVDKKDEPTEEDIAKEAAAKAEASAKAVEEHNKEFIKLVKEAADDEDTTAEEKLINIGKPGNTDGSRAAANIAAYLEHMHPLSLISEHQGVSHQHSLLASIKTIGEMDYSMFEPLWKIVNQAFVDHADNGATNPSYLMRYMHMWKWSQEDQKLLSYVCRIIGLLGDPETRSKNLKKIDMKAALAPESTGITETFADNLVKFYVA